MRVRGSSVLANESIVVDNKHPQWYKTLPAYELDVYLAVFLQGTALGDGSSVNMLGVVGLKCWRDRGPACIFLTHRTAAISNCWHFEGMIAEC